MTFKTRWEKASETIQLPDRLMWRMLCTVYSRDDISKVMTLPGGCQHVHALVQLGDGQAVVLRVYPLGKRGAVREQQIASLHYGSIPVAQFLHVGALDGYEFAIMAYLPGITLRDYLLLDPHPDIAGVMYQVGELLTDIARIRLPCSGFFNDDLSLVGDVAPDSLVGFCREYLAHDLVKSTLSQGQIDQINRFFEHYVHYLPSALETHLVHADFDPANILVQEVGGVMTVSGVIDWTFAFAGSTLFDVASMLRYARQMPAVYQDSFLQGLGQSGYVLPSTWRITVDLLNLVSLLDCLCRSDAVKQPRRIKDIQALVVDILRPDGVLHSVRA